MSVQTARGAQSFGTTLRGVIDRLASYYGAIQTPIAVPAETVRDRIRLCARPEADVKSYLSEPGWVVRVRTPNPFKDSGGGRHDYRVSRIVDVFVITMSLSDPGGRDDTAVYAHLDQEDLVLEALHDQPAVGQPNNSRIPVTFKWVPGGEDIVRELNIEDPGIIVSCLCFESIYRQPFLVNRD